jgi:hypothetical protein
MITPNPFLFHDFQRVCNFLFTPTFWRTKLGRETRATCTEIHCDFFGPDFFLRREGSIVDPCYETVGASDRSSAPVVDALSLPLTLCYGSHCHIQVEFSTECDLVLIFQFLVLARFLRVSSSCLRLLRLLVTYFLPSTLPSVTCFTSQFLRMMWLSFPSFYFM